MMLNTANTKKFILSVLSGKDNPELVLYVTTNGALERFGGQGGKRLSESRVTLYGMAVHRSARIYTTKGVGEGRAL